MTTAAERDRRIAAAERRITKATRKAAALHAEADQLDQIIDTSRRELTWWKDAPVTDPSPTTTTDKDQTA